MPVYTVRTANHIEQIEADTPEAACALSVYAGVSNPAHVVEIVEYAESGDASVLRKRVELPIASESGSDAPVPRAPETLSVPDSQLASPQPDEPGPEPVESTL